MNHNAFFILFIFLVLLLNGQGICSGSNPLSHPGDPVGKGDLNSFEKTAQYSGFLREGQYEIYRFSPGGKMAYIEWILSGCESSKSEDVSITVPASISAWRNISCGSDLNLYIYLNKDPRYCGFCYADRADTSRGSDAYAGWFNPCSSCEYHVIVSCKSGSAHYNLTYNTYTHIEPGSGEINDQETDICTDTHIIPDFIQR